MASILEVLISDMIGFWFRVARLCGAKKSTSGHPDDLLHHKGLDYGHRGWIKDWKFVGKDGEFSSQAEILIKSNNGDILKAAAVAGAGLLTMPTFIT